MAIIVGVLSGQAHAAPPPPAEEALFRVREGGAVTLDAGLALALPVALGTGLSTGAGAGVSVGSGHLAWGVRASWSTATEYSLDWTVSHDDIKLRVIGALQQRVGRARVALRLGLGPTIVHESRVRNLAARAHLTGLDTSTFQAAPAGDLEAALALHVAGPWLLLISGGPSLAVLDGGARWGWTSLLGAGWQP
ncbi:MAG TPA: hypothetical protein VFH68_11170 [Polyangia bacterium]|jgi:hypothetical protein|nr:hypothetical protein [Polyangia bacterium]